MSSKSNDQGRAYEYITLETLYSEISNVRKQKSLRIVAIMQRRVHGRI